MDAQGIVGKALDAQGLPLPGNFQCAARPLVGLTLAALIRRGARLLLLSAMKRYVAENNRALPVRIPDGVAVIGNVGVKTVPSLQNIRVRTTVQQVVVSSAIELVSATVAIKRIVAALAFENIRLFAAVQGVVALAASQIVFAAAAGSDKVAIATKDSVFVCSTLNGHLAWTLGALQVEGVLAISTGKCNVCRYGCSGKQKGILVAAALIAALCLYFAVAEIKAVVAVAADDRHLARYGGAREDEAVVAVAGGDRADGDNGRIGEAVHIVTGKPGYGRDGKILAVGKGKPVLALAKTENATGMPPCYRAEVHGLDIPEMQRVVSAPPG